MQRAQSERNDDICSKLLYLFQFFRVAACSDDLARSQVLRQLNSKSARRPGRTVDQNRFTSTRWARSTSAAQADIPGFAMAAAVMSSRASGSVTHRLALDGAELGESPEGRLRQGEIDSPPILRYTNTIRPGD